MTTEALSSPPLTSIREDLSLPTTTANFRAFVLKVGPLVDLQDTIEEIVFWKKPDRSILFLLCWTIASFFPKVMLLLPVVGMMLVLLQDYRHDLGGESKNIDEAEPSSPISLMDVKLPETSDASKSSTSSSAAIAPPTPSKSDLSLSAKYYRNIQYIQNLMGLYSQLHDILTPFHSLLLPSHPWHNTFLALLFSLFIITSLSLICIPTSAIVLPLGILPLIPFSPFTPPLTRLLPLKPRLYTLYLHLLSSRILPSQRGLPLRRIALYENQRLLNGIWSRDALKQGERGGWTEEDGSGAWGGKEEVGLESGWEWIEGEGWVLDWGDGDLGEPFSRPGRGDATGLTWQTLAKRAGCT